LFIDHDLPFYLHASIFVSQLLLPPSPTREKGRA
jgi:hypothetical protein